MNNINFRINELVSHFSNGNNSDFAKKVGVNEANVRNYIGSTEPKFSFLEKIVNTFEISYEWLLTGKGSMLKTDTSTPIPVKTYGKEGIPVLPFDAFAGVGEEAVGINFDAIEERYVIPLFDGMKVDFMISVRGSSMYPKYNSGDVVACRLIQELLFVQWNKVYVLDTISQGVVIKRLKKSEKEGYVVCKSDNESYDPFEIPMSDIRNMALVVGVIRQE